MTAPIELSKWLMFGDRAYLGPSKFARVLGMTENAATDTYEANKRFQKAVEELYKLYKDGEGSDAQRDAAIDHLEDAGLTKHRYSRSND